MIAPDRRAPRYPLVNIAAPIKKSRDGAHNDGEPNAAYNLEVAVSQRRYKLASISFNVRLKRGERSL
jgi:hypothetical protein